MRTLSFAAVVVAASADNYKCPGSSSWVHASAEVTALASSTCAEVVEEMKARIGGQKDGHWTDPHNGGTYKLVSASATEVQTQRFSNPTTSPGGKTYEDKQIFTLTEGAISGSGCTIMACSESQSTSVADFSTNYCNIRNLFVGSKGPDPATPHVLHDFHVTQKEVNPSIGAGKDPTKCVVKKVEEEKNDQFMQGGILKLTWKDCGDASTHGKVTGLTPDTLTLGTKTAVTGSGTVVEAVTDGSFKISVKAGFISKEFDGDICKAQTFPLPLGSGSVTWDGMKCPLAVGAASVPTEIEMSSRLPVSLAKANIQISATDSAGGKLLCMEIDTAPQAEPIVV
eukprot:TRINITY_DN73935_c0_g1_i1.p1 TRINITY_DN73935_c0_g1~~TRINITY_DN73935_c0_g1_i1.p1  ORF type:complete len:340 (+),score=63.08 TRINITY_DN73935_c0_g1_i1:78-1097(+)